MQSKEDIKTTEGLGGFNIEGTDDPRTKTSLPDVCQAKESDPEWVERKNPDFLPKYTQNIDVAGIGYDPGSGSLSTIMPETSKADKQKPQQSSRQSGSTTALLSSSHQISKNSDISAFGASGADTYEKQK